MRSWRILLLGGALVAVALVLLSSGLRSAHNAAANPLGGLVSIAAGEDHTCAITDTGGVTCWGSNMEGQLGSGPTSISDHSLSPQAIPDLGGTAVALSSGAYHTCALLQGGRMTCWGANGFGQLGTAERTLNGPVSVPGLSGTVISMSAGRQFTCAVIEGGSVQCWGDNEFGQLGSDAPACGTYFTCDGSKVQVQGIEDAVAVSAGFEHTCAIVSSGGVKCWGDNSYGQLGDTSGRSSIAPVDVVHLSDAVAIAAAWTHTCALTRAGAVKCWGYQYGNVAIDVAGVETGVVGLAAKQSHTCALMASGGVKCWGENGFGQLGDGLRCGTSCSAPVDVLSLENATQVSAGNYHTCAVLLSGTAKCWGIDSKGQLGNGMSGFGQFANVPVDVAEAQIKPTPTSTPCPEGGCPTPTPRPAPPLTGVDFSISVDANSDGIADCGTRDGETHECVMAQGSDFKVTVSLHALSADVSKYEGFDVFLAFAGVTSDHKSDVLWPDCGFPAVHYDASFLAFACAVPLGNITSSYVGPIGQSRFICTGSGSVTLQQGDGNTDVVDSQSTAWPEAASGGEQLIINCGEPRAGDVDCSVAVNSIDAALILQRDATLVDWLDCPQFADVNLDRRSNALDSLLTLQYSAGYVASLPVLPAGH